MCFTIISDVEVIYYGETCTMWISDSHLIICSPIVHLCLKYLMSYYLHFINNKGVWTLSKQMFENYVHMIFVVSFASQLTFFPSWYSQNSSPSAPEFKHLSNHSSPQIRFQLRLRYWWKGLWHVFLSPPQNVRDLSTCYGPSGLQTRPQMSVSPNVKWQTIGPRVTWPPPGDRWPGFVAVAVGGAYPSSDDILFPLGGIRRWSNFESRIEVSDEWPRDSGAKLIAGLCWDMIASMLISLNVWFEVCPCNDRPIVSHTNAIFVIKKWVCQINSPAHLFVMSDDKHRHSFPNLFSLNEAFQLQHHNTVISLSILLCYGHCLK